MSAISTTLSPAALESLIRRVVREELGSLTENRAAAVLNDLSHEGIEDPEEDELLLQEAMVRLSEARDRPETLMTLEDFQLELANAEAAGELPG